MLFNVPFPRKKLFKFGHVLHAGTRSTWRMTAGSLSSSTQAGPKAGISTTRPHKKALSGSRVIQTLDQSRLKPSDFQDFSNAKIINIAFAMTHDNKVLGRRWAVPYMTSVSGARATRLPFPQGTHGFLYYRPPDLLTPTRNTHPSDGIAGQIYFRITKDNDPASFASGRDLMHRNGDVPWYIVPKTNASPTLWQLLLKDGLVTASTKTSGPSRSPKPPISKFADPFIFDLSHRFIRVIVWSLRDGSAHRLSFMNPFRVQMGSGGRLRCHFERAPDSMHADANTFVIRVVEILSPIRYIPPPTAGGGEDEDSSALQSAPQVGELLLVKKGGRTPSFHSVGKKTETKSHSNRAWDVLLENEALTLSASTK